MRWPRTQAGFSLLELVLVIIIFSVLAATAARVITVSADRGKFEQTVQEMDQLVKALVGDEGLVQGGLRADFGYVGDVGGLPAAGQGLAALLSDPGVAGWNGPYVTNAFSGDPTGYRKDAWGTNYIYNPAAGTITSLGSDAASGGTAGTYEEDIVRTITSDVSKLTGNAISVVALDGKGSTLNDTHVTVTVTYPGMTGGSTTYASGAFTRSSIPIGLHTVSATPTAGYSAYLGSALDQRICVYPRGASTPSSLVVRFVGSIPSATSAIEYVAGSIYTQSGGRRIYFTIRNTGSMNISFNAFSATWTNPGDELRKVRIPPPVERWSGHADSGEKVTFSSSYLLPQGATVECRIEFDHNMGGEDISVTFYDGSNPYSVSLSVP